MTKTAPTPAKFDTKDPNKDLADPCRNKIDTVIVGAGQAGLAMSCCLVERGIPHVVLERGRLVERWQSERWDSLRLLTPNWMTRLPGNYHYQGDDPDGFMTAAETARFFHEYADSFRAPVKTHTEVVRVERLADEEEDPCNLLVTTRQGQQWIARNLVIATGFCGHPRVASFSTRLPPTLLQMGPSDYHRPSQLPSGSVLIIGASATGCQIARELVQYNHKKNEGYFDEIFISVGRHTRLPRRYRGRDILFWLYEIGFFDAPCDLALERQSPAPQIIGTPNHSDLDLAILQRLGVRLVGRTTGLVDGKLHFEGESIRENLSTADTKLNMLLTKIDEYIAKEGIKAEAPKTINPVPCPLSPPTELDVGKIRTLIWATGYDRSYPWLESMPSVLDKETGDVLQHRGITPEKGVYILGMRFQMTKISNFIDGVGADAEELAGKIAQRIDAK